MPRFVSLKKDKVNMRQGPGADHQIIWVYVRKNLPVEIVNEFENWREVRDVDGAQGWVSEAMLAGEPRYGVVIGKSAGHGVTGAVRPRPLPKDRADGWPLLRGPSADAREAALVAPGVVVEIKHCPKEYCEVRAGNAFGWMSREALWGVYSSEVIK